MIKIVLNGFPIGNNKGRAVVMAFLNEKNISNNTAIFKEEPDNEGFIRVSIDNKYGNKIITISVVDDRFKYQRIEKTVDIRGVIHTFSFEKDIFYLRSEHDKIQLNKIDVVQLYRESQDKITEEIRKSRYDNKITKYCILSILLFFSIVGLFVSTYLGAAIIILSLIINKYATPVLIGDKKSNFLKREK